MELQGYADSFREKGLGLCAISYDSVEILADFARRQNITYTLLSDPGSRTIRAFGILNTTVPEDHMQYGIPHPGTYIVDSQGVVQSKYFENRFQERFSAPTILFREFGSKTGTRETTVQTDHLDLRYYSTQDEVHPDLRFTLVAELDLKPKMHVYSPEVKNYIPIRFTVEPSENYSAHAVEYPAAETLYLPAIQESVPVFQGRFQIQQDVTLAGEADLKPILQGSQEIRIQGSLRYQACDDKICYLPRTLPLEWTLRVSPLERTRVPEPIQHKDPAAPEN